MTTLSVNTALIEERLQQLITALIKQFDEYSRRNYGHPSDTHYLSFEIRKGTRYYKLIMRQGTGTSVHAFISRQTGAMYKPASWKAPAKHVRYNLLDDTSFAECLRRADWAGRYLYL
jgi:hypothetical protein